jgi:hypothetical protein
VADTTIRAIIKLLVEGGHIPKEVAKQIKDVGDTSDDAKKKVSGLGAASKELSGLLKQYLGAAALGAFIRSSVTEFASLDRQFNTVGFTLKRLGIGGAQDLARIRAELEQVATSGGPLVSQTVPALQKFLVMTRDIDKAMAAVKLSVDVSETGVVDFGQAANGVAQILQGKLRAAATTFAIDLTHANGVAKTNAEILKEIQATYGGVGDAFNDAANDLDSINAQWERAKQIVGQGLAPALKVIPDILFHIIGGFKDIGEVAGLVVNTIIAEFEHAGAVLGAVFDFKTLFTDVGKYGENVGDAVLAATEDMKIAWETFTEGVVANHTKAAAKVGDTTKGMSDLITQAAKATSAEEAKAAQEAAEKRIEAERQVLQQTLQAQIAAAKQGSDERLALELTLLDEQEKAAVDQARRVGADVAKVQEAFLEQRAALEEQYRQAREEADFEAETSRLRAEADLLAEGSAERLNAELAMLERERIHQLAEYQGTTAGKEAIDAAYLAARAALIKAHEDATNQKTLEDYAALLAAKAELDAAAAELAVLYAEQGQGALFEARQKQIELQYQQELDALTAQQLLDEQAAKAKGESIDGIEQQYRSKRLAAEKRFVASKIQLDREEVRAKQEAGMAIAAASIGFARAAFGNKKAVQIAEIIMNTAGAVMSIWDKWAWNPPVAGSLTVLAIATGAAQLAKVRSAQPEGGSGKGFDDPEHDRMARLGGRRWADDFVRETETGFREGIRTARDEGRGPTLSPMQRFGVEGASTRDVIRQEIRGLAPALSPMQKLDREAVAMREVLRQELGAGALGDVARLAATSGGSGDVQRIAETIKEVIAPVAAPAEEREPQAVDQSVHFHGPVYGGEEGGRQLVREIDRWRRLDGNRKVS